MDPNNPYGSQQPPPHNPHNPYSTYTPPGFGMPLAELPNATVIMVMGICSIVICALGPILGAIALVLGQKAKAEFESKPGVYDPGSYSNVKTGRICGIIGICVGFASWVAIGFYIWWIWYLTTMMNEAMQNMPQ